jgi:hypothetical protein
MSTTLVPVAEKKLSPSGICHQDHGPVCWVLTCKRRMLGVTYASASTYEDLPAETGMIVLPDRARQNGRKAAVTSDHVRGTRLPSGERTDTVLSSRLVT